MQWLDGHPLSMRLVLPHLTEFDPDVLLAELQDGSAASPMLLEAKGATSWSAVLGASLGYSFSHLDERTRGLLLAASLFRGTLETVILGHLPESTSVPDRFRGAELAQWKQAFDNAANVGMLTAVPLGSCYRLHPALPGYLSGMWRWAAGDDYPAERAATEEAFLRAFATFTDLMSAWVDLGHLDVVLEVTNRNRQTISWLLGRAVDDRRWPEAQSLVQALDRYWSAHYLNEEAEAWLHRIRSALTGPPGLILNEDGALNLWKFLVSSNVKRLSEMLRIREAEALLSELSEVM
jgi:hypothetical protein